MKSIFFPKKKNPVPKIKLDSKITRNQIPYNSFQKLKVVNDFNVFIVFSETEEEIVIEANANLHEYIKYAYDEGVLVIKKAGDVQFKGECTQNLYIKTKPFFDFHAGDDSNITLESLVKNQHVHVRLKDDSKLIATVEANQMSITADEDAIVTLKGTVNELQLRLKEDSQFDCFDLAIQNLDAHLSSDSVAKVSVANSLNIKLTGDSEFTYKGNPTINTKEISGGSSFNNVSS